MLSPHRILQTAAAAAGRRRAPRAAHDADLAAGRAAAEEAGRRRRIRAPTRPCPAASWSSSSTSPVCGSIRRNSLESPSQVPCHSSSPSPGDAGDEAVGLDGAQDLSGLGSTWWILRARYWPTHSEPSADAMPELPPSPGAGIVASTWPVLGSIFWMRFSNQLEQVRSVERRSRMRVGLDGCARIMPLSGSKALSWSPEANHTTAVERQAMHVAGAGKGAYPRRIRRGI